MRHKTNTRPDRKYAAHKVTQTLVAGNYAKTGERGFGLVHAIVSNHSSTTPFLQAKKPFFLSPKDVFLNTWCMSVST